MQNNNEFLKCQHCERLFFTKTGFKNHNMKEHQNEEGSLEVSDEEKCLNFERNCFSKKSGNFKQKKNSEMIQIGESEIIADIDEQKTESLAPKPSNEKKEDEIGLSGYGEVQNPKLIKNNLTDDPKFLTNIEEEPAITNNSAEKGVQKVGQYNCRLCEKTFVNKGYVKQHIADVNEKLKPYKCPLCEKTFTRENTVKIHISTVHEKLKPCKCHLCEKSFSTKRSVKIHITAVHEKLKPFNCDLCGKKFSYKGQVKIHIADVHDKLKKIQMSLV